jgi:hypothetical protein
MRPTISRTAHAASRLGLGFVLILLLQFAPPAFGQVRTAANSVTLPQLFPELTNLPATTTLAIAIGWLGLSPLSPIDAVYSLALRNDQFEGDGKFSVAAASATRAVTIPSDIVRAFLVAVTKVELVEKDYTPRITHTDDYPSLSVMVQTGRGVLQIGTRSQQQRPKSGTYVDRTPWAITYLGRTFVVTASDLDQAFDPWESHLQYGEAIDEQANKIRKRNHPEK